MPRWTCWATVPGRTRHLGLGQAGEVAQRHGLALALGQRAQRCGQRQPHGDAVGRVRAAGRLDALGRHFAPSRRIDRQVGSDPDSPRHPPPGAVADPVPVVIRPHERLGGDILGGRPFADDPQRHAKGARIQLIEGRGEGQIAIGHRHQRRLSTRPR